MKSPKKSEKAMLIQLIVRLISKSTQGAECCFNRFDENPFSESNFSILFLPNSILKTLYEKISTIINSRNSMVIHLLSYHNLTG
jgi:hypothetical protein